MKRMWVVLLCLALSVPVVLPVHAQTAPPWLQVWLVRAPDTYVVEYRDAAGTVRASYQLSEEMFVWPQQAGGRLFNTTLEHIQVFDPYVGQTKFYATAVAGLSTETDIYGLRSIAPRPDGRGYAYGVMLYHSDWELPATSFVYLATTGAEDDRIVHFQETETVRSIEPFGWSDDGSILLLHEMPVGIGGYILFWTYQNVLSYNLSTGLQLPLGDVDGLTGDAHLIGRLNFSDGGGPVSLSVSPDITASGVEYPIPSLGEQPQNGGGAVFSPSGARVAYQVARSDPERENFWTIVIDLNTGQSRVVLVDEATGYDLNYGYIGGWLDDTTLVIGSGPDKTSVVIDVITGTVLRQENGIFMGYATGITDTTGFAAPGPAQSQCPGTPASRLQSGQRGRITYTDGTQTNVRAAPGTSAAKVGSVAEGSTFSVLGGPFCADSYAWWNVQFDTGLAGFVAEGDATSYYIEPWQ